MFVICYVIKSNYAFTWGFVSSEYRIHAYLQFQSFFSHLPREFKSPFGVLGSTIVAIIFTFIFISLIGFQSTSDALIAYIIVLCLVILCHYSVARKYQYLSDEDQQLFASSTMNNPTMNNPTIDY